MCVHPTSDCFDVRLPKNHQDANADKGTYPKCDPSFIALFFKLIVFIHNFIFTFSKLLTQVYIGFIPLTTNVYRYVGITKGAVRLPCCSKCLSFSSLCSLISSLTTAFRMKVNDLPCAYHHRLMAMATRTLFTWLCRNYFFFCCTVHTCYSCCCCFCHIVRIYQPSPPL